MIIPTTKRLNLFKMKIWFSVPVIDKNYDNYLPNPSGGCEGENPTQWRPEIKCQFSVVARLAEVLVVWLGIIQREEMQQAFALLTLLMHLAGRFV